MQETSVVGATVIDKTGELRRPAASGFFVNVAVSPSFPCRCRLVAGGPVLTHRASTCYHTGLSICTPSGDLSPGRASGFLPGFAAAVDAYDSIQKGRVAQLVRALA